MEKYRGFLGSYQIIDRRSWTSVDEGLAERQGFEPWIRFWRILTFQASAFDHSATAPHALEAVGPNRMEALSQAAKAGTSRLL